MNKVIGIAIFLISLLSCQSSTEIDSLSEQPNIVFIFTDDQTYTAIHALGNEEIITPNMDRLVKSGTTFTHAYNMGGWNGAVCAASRAMMLSGRYLWRANQYRQNWIDRDSSALEQTWSKLMKAAGYDTYMTGKWHIDAPAELVFDNVTHIRPGMPKDNWEHFKMKSFFENEIAQGKYTVDAVMPIGYNRPKTPQDNYWNPVDTSMGGFWEGGKHWSEVLKDDATAFIKKAAKNDNPFFMYLAFNAPHDPRQSPQEYLDMYPIENISVPKSFIPEYPDKEKIGVGQDLRDEALAPFPRTPYAVKKHIQEYYALVSHLDHQIGEILNELEASGKMENTYIFFAADHGLAIGRHGLLGKQNLYDHSIRVPLIIAGKDIPKNKKIDTDIYLQDIMATSLDLAHIVKPSYVEFNSFLDIAKGEKNTSFLPAVYGAYIDYQRMIRKDGFKLIAYPKMEKLLLFDLVTDPEEMDNLAELPEYKTKVDELFSELLKLQKEYGDDLKMESIAF